MTPVTSTNEENIVLSVEPKTASGNPATVDGNIKGEVLEGSAEIEEIDGKSIRIKNATDGVNRIRIYADADLDEGEVREIEEEVVYTVTGAEASTLGVTVATEPRA